MVSADTGRGGRFACTESDSVQALGRLTLAAAALPDPVVPRLVRRLLVLGLLAVLGRIVGQRSRAQLHLPGVGSLRSGVGFVAGNLLLCLSRVGSAEVLPVGTQIVTIRS